MTASSVLRRITLSLAGALLLTTVASILTAGVMAAQPASALRQTERTLRISVNTPGTVTSGSTVTMRCRAKDQTGKAIRGVSVSFRWRLPEETRTQSRATNADGIATAARVTDCGSAGDYQARVVVTASWRGQSRQITRSFTIVGDT